VACSWTPPRTASYAGQPLKLGPTEFRLLHYLMKHAERVHSRAQLLDKVWGDHVFIEERTVDVHVKRLREALGEAMAHEDRARCRLPADARPRQRGVNRGACLMAAFTASPCRRRSSPLATSMM
jgi:hypothetical protein